MTATKRRAPRRNSSRDRAPRHVEPVLDPTWQSPYAPSAEEREENRTAVRVDFWRRRRLGLLGVGFAAIVAVIVLGAVVSIAVGVLGLVVAVIVGGALYGVLEMRCRSLENASMDLAERLRASFTPAGTAKDVQRLATVVDRLSATFGLNDVRPLVVSDEGFNAALVANVDGFDLLVTSALMHEFELIELEGVIAHLMARQRLGALERQAAASVAGLDVTASQILAGKGLAYRADEVAAAAIRYPNGLAQALARCAHHHVSNESYFSSSAYPLTRWIWFDQFADRPTNVTKDIDDASVRSRALVEW